MRIATWAFLVAGLLRSTAMAEEPPKVVQAATPGYPHLASGGRLEGEVLVDMELAPDGSVLKAQAKSGPAMLRTSAEGAARKWRFEAVRHGGDKVQVIFAFILQEGLGDPPAVVSLFKAPNRLEVFAGKREIVVISDPPVEDVVKKQKKRRP